jgi:3-hydroxyacyl-[acyl-carrier protein] dehydratase/trans-2-decenoyl-[acyl-carrier protein] isomerase
VIRRKLTLGIGDGHLKADDVLVYSAKDLRVGLFTVPNMGMQATG